MIARAIKIIFFVLAVSSIPWATNAATVAPVPPMGWNSWDAYGTTVREEEVKANADYMAKHLARYGWQYIIVDIEWYTPKPKTHGYIPDPFERDARQVWAPDTGSRAISLLGGWLRIHPSGGLYSLEGVEVWDSHHARHSP